MKKTFVIDTNVLLHDPEALMKFPKHNIVIPLTVLEELDKMKRLPSDLGRNSRAVARKLVTLKNLGHGDFHKGLKLENGSEIRIETEI
ncbi:MAG: PhoH family protein, partial [Chlamydiia bacterium]|nr:PhoH family protein [Chlamydiia bacterium]